MARKTGMSRPSGAKAVRSAAKSGGALDASSVVRKPWQAFLKLDLAAGETSKLVNVPVPGLNKRVVIEFGSAQLLVLKTQVPYIQLQLSMTGSDPSISHTFALANVGSYCEGQYVWQSCHRVYLTCAQGSVRVLRAGGTSGPFFATLSLSGYVEENG